MRNSKVFLFLDKRKIFFIGEGELVGKLELGFGWFFEKVVFYFRYVFVGEGRRRRVLGDLRAEVAFVVFFYITFREV